MAFTMLVLSLCYSHLQALTIARRTSHTRPSIVRPAPVTRSLAGTARPAPMRRAILTGLRARTVLTGAVSIRMIQNLATRPEALDVSIPVFDSLEAFSDSIPTISRNGSTRLAAH